jgi:hypothetical protein
MSRELIFNYNEGPPPDTFENSNVSSIPLRSDLNVFNHRLAVDSHTATHFPYFLAIE